ncbi:MAG: aminofutalosine synthase MqnE [Candidatus Brocadiae bacterium]|nr:aminofutalosine synthase MqnE [Candidatus Brocadiia bacterium]
MEEKDIFLQTWMKDAALEDIYSKVLEGKRLSREDGIRLYQNPNLLAVGKLADIVRRKKNGNYATYVYNQHINYSNICLNRCRFCAFGKDENAHDAFELSLEKIEEAIQQRMQEPVTEIHIVGSIHPKFSYAYYLGIIKTVKRLRPKAILKAFTPVEIAHIAKLANMPVKDTLQELHAAGLDALPGGGAEIFSHRVRQEMCPEKLSGEEWLNIMKTAHRLGIQSNATMLYGHIERIEEKVDHILAIREAQDETQGFLCFIPLAFHSQNTPFAYLPTTCGIEDLKNIAVSRLLLDNVLHIKAYWIMLGLKLAQVALSFGADDLDGTIFEEKIAGMAGRTSPDSLTVKTLQNLIQEAGFIPRERNTYFYSIKKG